MIWKPITEIPAVPDPITHSFVGPLLVTDGKRVEFGIYDLGGTYYGRGRGFRIYGETVLQEENITHWAQITLPDGTPVS